MYLAFPPLCPFVLILISSFCPHSAAAVPRIPIVPLPSIHPFAVMSLTLVALSSQKQLRRRFVRAVEFYRATRILARHSNFVGALEFCQETQILSEHSNVTRHLNFVMELKFCRGTKFFWGSQNLPFAIGRGVLKVGKRVNIGLNTKLKSVIKEANSRLCRHNCIQLDFTDQSHTPPPIKLVE